MPSHCCFPPPPVTANCVYYGNQLGEREWSSKEHHEKNPQGSLVQQKQHNQYERVVKSCDPCELPQAHYGRMFDLPKSVMECTNADNYSPQNPPCPEEMPPDYTYVEDQGECDKRQTVGVGPYCGPGHTLTTLCYANMAAIPCGFFYSEQQTQCKSKAITPPSQKDTCFPPPGQCPPPCPGSPGTHILKH